MPTRTELDELAEAYARLNRHAIVVSRCDSCGARGVPFGRARHVDCPAPPLPADVVELLERMRAGRGER